MLTIRLLGEMVISRGGEVQPSKKTRALLACLALTGRPHRGERLCALFWDLPQALEDAGSWCLDQHHIRFLGTFIAKDRRRMICLYAAPDAESVRLTNRRLQLPFERAWAARVFGPDVGLEAG